MYCEVETRISIRPLNNGFLVKTLCSNPEIVTPEFDTYFEDVNEDLALALAEYIRELLKSYTTALEASDE